MKPFAHDVEELKRILAELGASAFEQAYLDYCAALLLQREADREPRDRKAA